MVEKLAIEIALEGGPEMQQQFAAATSSISKLGNTAEEAFAGASAAAQKFSASTAELGQVEGVIKALAARARDTSTSFSQLAANYDAARQSAATLVPAVAKVEQALKTTTNTATETRHEVRALAEALNLMGGGPLGRIGTTLANIGTRFGALAAASAAVGGAAAALIKFVTAAEGAEKALTQLQAVSGQSFKSLSALSNVFAQGGTPVKEFATEFGNLSDKIRAAGEAAAKKWAIAQQAEDAAKGLKVTELGAITLKERVDALLESLANVPPTQQWFALADIFKKLKDAGNDLEAAQIGKALGLSPETIATLSLGSEKLKEMAREADQLGLTLTSSNQKALQEMSQGWNQFTALVSQLFQKIGALAAPAFAAILNSFKPVIQGIVSDFENMPLEQAISNLGTRLAPAFEALGKVLEPIIIALATTLAEAFVSALAGAISKAINDAFSAGIQNMKDKWLGGGQPPVAPENRRFFAGGGYIGGSGTGTSDSNLAWVSRGEYITPAAAVGQPGVLAFLEALRRSGGNLSRVLDGMGRFALGGMVRSSMPAFAAGGLAGGSNVTIAFPGLPPISGLRASSDVVEQLHRAASLAQVRSGGRKPSRYA